MAQVSTDWIELAAITKALLNADVAGNGISGGAGSALTVQKDGTASGNTVDVLSVTSDGVSVQVDDSAIEANGSDQLTVKALGITNAMLAGSIADGKLAEVYSKADGSRAFTGIVQYNTTKSFTNDLDLVSKDYVDAVAEGLQPKASVQAVETSSNMDLTGLETIDGVSLAEDDRVLLTAQTDDKENGIWVVKTTAWVRPDDFAAGFSASGSRTYVTEGTDWEGTGWVCISDAGADTVGTHDLFWTQFSGTGVIIAGTGLSKDGNTLNVGEGAGMTVGADTVAVAPAKLIQGGDAEIDGDKIDIDLTPDNYTPVTDPAEVDDVDQLSAHLAGIDDALGGISYEQIKQYMHLVTAGEDTAGYLTLPSSPVNAQSVRVFTYKGILQINKQVVGATGASPDFDVLSTTQVHINNNGAASGLTGDIKSGDILVIFYQE